MNIPKIIFREMSLEENIELIKWAYFEDNGSLDVHYYTIQYFPELANIADKTPKEDTYKIIEDVVASDYNKYKERIKEGTKRYNDLWNKYNDNYFIKLTEYLGVNWPDEIKTIEVTVGLMPVFPRYLDVFSFSISTGVEDWKLIETCAHETLHFLWFEKWKVLHPETPRREYNSPYITWQYSEMVTDPILNNAPFDKMFEFTERSYDSFYEIYDNNDDLLMDKLRNIYKKDISIEEKIDTGFELVKNITKKKKNI